MHPTTHSPHAILSFGSFSTLCGYVGEPEPRWSIPSNYNLSTTPHPSHVSYPQLIKLLNNSTTFSSALESITRFTQTIFFKYLLTNPHNVHVIILENILTSSKFKESITYILLKRLRVPSLLFLYHQPFSPFALRLHSALVVDVGHSTTTILPIVFGSALTCALRVAPVGALHVHERLGELLETYPSLTSSELTQNEQERTLAPIDPKVLEKISRRFCFVPSKFSKPVTCSVSDSCITLIVSDAHSIQIRPHIRSEATTVLFESPEANLPRAILESIHNAPIDTRTLLVSNILCVGGGACFPGFQKRLSEELNSLLQNFPPLRTLQGKFRFVESKRLHRRYLSWIYSSMALQDEIEFDCNKITRDEYLEKRKNIPDWTNLTHEPFSTGS
ncbi:actin-related protein 10-like [Schistocerca gregaria]|uniref:actin-related protein 10-like n=1 Tax=Schistocerca gregaria TaxID=7010 RepID=UPI00211DDF6F|nr:actin-related protein 10-like [Schistocerca gregaria]